VKRMGLAVLVTALGGCASWSPETRIEEAAYQALNVADYAQTREVARRADCYHEVDSAWIVGAHPSERSTTALFAAQAALHLGVTAILEDRGAPPWAVRLWQAATIGLEGREVYRNWQIGLRFGSTAAP